MEVLILHNKRIALTCRYMLKVCAYLQTGNYEDDESFHVLASELEEIDEE